MRQQFIPSKYSVPAENYGSSDQTWAQWAFGFTPAAALTHYIDSGPAPSAPSGASGAPGALPTVPETKPPPPKPPKPLWPWLVGIGGVTVVIGGAIWYTRPKKT